MIWGADNCEEPTKESFSIAVAEVMATKTPSIVANTAALRDKLLQIRGALGSQNKVYHLPPQRSWDDIARKYENILNRLVSEK